MPGFLLLNARIVTEEKVTMGDLRIRNGRIETIGTNLSGRPNETLIDLKGDTILPGIIDDQVHFREPGFPQKGDIATESKAAVAGGVTSFMEMPNTNPTTTNAEALEDKLNRAKGRSWANFAFFFGATNHNLEEVLRVNPEKTCGIKIFMGSSTGDMLVDHPQILEKIFSSTSLVVATHCEDELTIRENLARAKEQFGEQIPFENHPLIRSREACIKSSKLAIDLANRFGTQLHILHLTTAEEPLLFTAGPMSNKNITAEVCVHHLHFTDSDYKNLGGQIKCNPAIKTVHDRDALWKALNDDRIDIIASDHAPHTWEEKQQPYLTCPSGLPLVQHELNLMLDAVYHKKISIEKIVRKMCHNPADRFRISDRGYIREGYRADLVVVNPEAEFMINQAELQYHCTWSPLVGEKFMGKILRTFVNGNQVYNQGEFSEPAGVALTFNRK